MDLQSYINSHRFHPIQKEPPIAHALANRNETDSKITYEYNGRNIIEISFDTNEEISQRNGSDGNISSAPLSQQIYVMIEDKDFAEVNAKVRFNLSGDALNMRPRRAKSNQSIIGQVENPLLYDVNGIYDVEQDLLISWYGCKWKWLSDSLSRNPDKTLSAELEVEVTSKPWIINLYYRYYQMHLGYKYHEPWKKKKKKQTIAGWCSWEAFRRSVNQKNIEDASQFFSKSLKPYGFEYIQLDDGFEQTPIPPNPESQVSESWVNTNNQFPLGHEGVIHAIKQNGLKPGVWTHINITNPDFGKLQSEFLIKDKNGKPLPGEWIDLILDCTKETIEKHVKPVYKGLQEKGYEYLKVDGIRHLLMDGLHEAVRLGLISNKDADEKFRRFLESVRDSLGEDTYLLASWGVMGELVGIADACRTSMDANPTWAGIRMQLFESARWFFTQRVLFLNDPDHICARANIEWVRSIASLVSISGQLFMLSDPIQTYHDERLDIIKKCLPPLTTVTGETGPLELEFPAYTWTKLHGFAVPRENPVTPENMSLQGALNMAGNHPGMNDDHPFGSLWAIHLCQGFKKWAIVGRFALSNLKDCSLKLEDLNLDPRGQYIVFDFWKQKYLGKIEGTLPVCSLSFGNCQILAVTRDIGHPQIIASDRHISMDIISIEKQSWHLNGLQFDLNGIENSCIKYWIYSPQNYVMTKVTSENEVIYKVDGEIIELDIFFSSNKCSVEIEFTQT
jgi:uncharacterized protein (UPF0297 family)